MTKLTDGPVRARLFDIWLPMIGGVLAVKAIGLSDAYFVGRLGEQPLAAISFVFPVVMTLISVAIGLSAGASSVLARAIGDDADDETRQAIVTGAMGMAVVVAVVLTVLGVLAIGPTLRLMGADEQILSDGIAYMRIWFAGTLFLIVPIAVNGMLRAAGDGVSPALLMAAVAVVNIGLNPLFIFGAGFVPGFGMQGAAVATVLARALSMAVALWLIWHRGLLRFSVGRLKNGLQRWREVAEIGLPAAVSTSVNPIALSIVTAAAATIGSAEVAAFGVVSKIQSFAVVPLLALSSATPALVGQNSSAGEFARSRKTLYWCALISVVWSLLIAVFFLFAADWVVGFFTDETAVREPAALYLMIVPLSLAGYGLAVALSAAMNGLGRSITALLIGAGRALVLLAPLAWLGVWLDGFRGLAIATVTANVVAGLVCLVIIHKDGLHTRDDDDGSCEPDHSESG